MLPKNFVSKILPFISIFTFSSFLLAIAPFSRGWAMDDGDTFVSKARLYAETYGVKTVTRAANEWRNKFIYIPDDTGFPFAVIKKGTRVTKEAFISSYTRSLRLENVALSKNVDDLLFEEYLSLRIPSTPLEEDLERFVRKYEKNNSLILQSITKNALPEDMKTLLKYLDVDSVHKIFAYVILVNGTDSDPKNIALRLNQESKLEMHIFDTELAFAEKAEKSILFYLPFVDVPLSEKTRNIVLSWTPEEISNARKYVSEESFHLNQQSRIQDFQNYLRAYPQATPMDIMLFAFFKTPKAQWSDGHINTQGTDYISRINLGEITKMNLKKIEDFGCFFKGKTYGVSESYLAAVYDYNTAREGQEKSLADFINFIPNQDCFILEKLSEYKSYVKEKFGWEL
jgi:hypothetical protein